MKLILRRIFPGLILSFLLGIPAGAQTRLATIDLKKVFENYWKRQQAEAALKVKATELDNQFKSMMDDYTKTKEDYNKLLNAANDQSVSADERAKRKDAAEAKLLEIKTSENSLRTFESNAREQLDMQRNRMRDEILKEIRSTISAKAKAQTFTLVFDSAAETANKTPFLLYTTGENDMTEAVLSQLNAAAPPTEPAKTEEKK